MSATPWVKWFSGDFLNGVADLEADEGWVYVIALNLIYDRGGPVPFEVDRLARRCRLRRNVVDRVVRQLVEVGKLTLVDGKLSNPKAERMLKGRLKASEDSSEAARIRWEKDKQNKGGDDATAMPSQCDRNAIPEARIQKLESPLPPKGEKKRVSSKGTTIPDGFPDTAALQIGRDMVLAAGVAVHVRTEGEKFRDYALGRGEAWKKADWLATWRNWIRTACERAPSLGIAFSPTPAPDTSDPWPDRIREWQRSGDWKSGDWGPPPDSPKTEVAPRYLDCLHSRPKLYDIAP
jgi:hypothetical protein